MQKRAMYYYTRIAGLQSKIQLSPEWAEYFAEN